MFNNWFQAKDLLISSQELIIMELTKTGIYINLVKEFFFKMLILLYLLSFVLLITNLPLLIFSFFKNFTPLSPTNSCIWHLLYFALGSIKPISSVFFLLDLIVLLYYLVKNIFYLFPNSLHYLKKDIFHLIFASILASWLTYKDIWS